MVSKAGRGWRRATWALMATASQAVLGLRSGFGFLLQRKQSSILSSWFKGTAAHHQDRGVSGYRKN